MSLLPTKLLSLRPPSTIIVHSYPRQGYPNSRRQTSPNSVVCAKRTGKQRYPSEKKKLKLKRKEILVDVKQEDKFDGLWRLSKLGVPAGRDPGKDFLGVSDGLLEAIAKVIEFPVIFYFSFSFRSYVLKRVFNRRDSGNLTE